MKRIMVALVAGMSLLALALSAPAAGVAADPGPGTSQTKSDLVRISSDRALAFGCQAGYSCYYSQVGGGGDAFMATRCGIHDLRGHPLQDRIFSIHNRGNGVASLNNFNGNGLELKGWVHPEGAGRTGTGNFPVNVGADAIYIHC
jgi:hypothetical protein